MFYKISILGGSPISKHDSIIGDCESDEKNPDIIPQPLDSDEITDYVRKKQHVSTIETTSSSVILSPSNNPNANEYMNYCTLRNGMPLHDMSAQSKMVSFDMT